MNLLVSGLLGIWQVIYYNLDRQMVYLKEVPKQSLEAYLPQAQPEIDVTNLETYQDLSQQLINGPFENPQLLQTAFTHPSYYRERRRRSSTNGQRSDLENNKRLIFLGDTVLNTIVTQSLYLNYEHSENALTIWRQALTHSQNLAQVAQRLNFGQYLRLSKGMDHSNSLAQEQALLTGTLKAVIGAIYLDRGQPVVTEFIDRQIIVTLADVLQNDSWRDVKNCLQEYLQNTMKQMPVYKVLSETLSSYHTSFAVGVYVKGQLCGQGQGRTKKLAEQAAAQAALDFYDVQSPKLAVLES